jgi:hypothetical protein
MLDERYDLSERGLDGKRSHTMKKLALIAALLLASSPVAAQSRQQPLGAGGQTNTSSLPNTGVICIEEMTATFCNVPSSPSHGGYGSTAASGSTAGSSSSGGFSSTGGAGSSTPSRAIPICSEFPPANELCN